MAGSSAASLDEMKQRTAARTEGAHILSRVPGSNEYQIPAMGMGGRLLVALSRIRQAGKDAGKEVKSVEQLSLYSGSLAALLAILQLKDRHL